MVDAKVEWLTVEGDPDVWRAIGLTVAADGLLPLIGTSLRIVPPSTPGEPKGIVGWALSGIDPVPGGTVDGLTTEVVDPATPVFGAHDIGASGLDHVVVLTDDLERTSEAIAITTGCPLKRVREVGPMRQGFHRIGRGGLIVELVSRPDIEPGPAAFWGLVLNVEDLDAACRHIGPGLIGAPKDAVQPGRRIATVRADAGLGLPVALMTA